MIIVGHLTIGMHDPVKPGTDVAKDFQPGFSFVIGSINGVASVSS